MTVFVPQIRVEPEESSGDESSVPLEFDFESPYDVLGVPRDASPEEAKEAAFALRRSFERRALQGDAAAGERLARVNRAMEMLTKPEKRAESDLAPGATFLAIEDPAPIERVGWADGLRLIAERTLGRDPIEEILTAEAPVEPRPNAILDALLRSLGSGKEG